MDKDFEVFDERFNAIIAENSKLEKLYTGTIWAEGPCYFAEEGYLVWSDIPNNRMLKWSEADGAVTEFRKPSNYVNGNTRDLQGRLISCEHGGRRVSRTEADGTIVSVVDNYDGKRFNSPNDVVVKSDGTIWFTDPPYGILPGTKEGYASESKIGGCHVYRYDPTTDEVSIVADDFDKPNGIAFSPDEQRLYIADTGGSHTPNGPHHIRVFDVVDGRRLANGRLFADIEPGLADGFRFDVNSHLYTSSADSIQVYAEDGTRLGKIYVPEVIANCTFGGKDKNRLFITATSSLYAIYLNTRGVQTP